ncbi:MAG TPA: cytochrome b/b6 domain-containing protein [Usitatibacter sp.]|nr:cytochrome b/b6 domain-containing protein [Usitatibacter sp.]
MELRNTASRYGAVAQSLHWIVAILVLAAFWLGPGGNETRVYSAARDSSRSWHETLGLCVLALALVRLLWRGYDRAPEEVPVPAWMSRAAKAGHALLYVMLFLVPCTAITGAWLEGHPLTLPGGVRVGPWIAESHALGAQVAWLHTWLGDAIVWLAGFHAAAGL